MLLLLYHKIGRGHRNNMRVCLIDEPWVRDRCHYRSLLAEAAYLLMPHHKAFDLPRALLSEFEGPGLDKGNRGELISLVLLLIAGDFAAQQNGSAAIDVLLFMRKFLASKWCLIISDSKPARCRTTEDQCPFSEVFAGSRMHFNHFIKVHDFRVAADSSWRCSSACKLPVWYKCAPPIPVLRQQPRARQRFCHLHSGEE